METSIKATIELGLAYSFRGLIHFHHFRNMAVINSHAGEEAESSASLSKGC